MKLWTKYNLQPPLKQHSRVVVCSAFPAPVPMDPPCSRGRPHPLRVHNPRPGCSLSSGSVSSGIKYIYWNISHKKRFSLGHSHARGGEKRLPTHREGSAHTFNGCGRGSPSRGSGARGVVAAEALVHAVQQVLGQAVPGTGQHLLEANHSLEAQPDERSWL